MTATVGDIQAVLPPEAVGMGAPPTGDHAPIVFRSPSELRQTTPTAPDWVWEHNAAEGFVTVVGGRPKVGKSTLVYEAVNRLADGDDHPFLECSMHPTPVVVISEEHGVTAIDKFPTQSENLRVLTRDALWPLPTWSAVLAAARTEADRVEARMVLVDSFTFWARMDSEAGKDSGAVQAHFEPLLELSREGLAVVLIHHQRKGGGDFGEALMGSTAFAANADIILEVERAGEGSPSNWRQIQRLSRVYSPAVTVAAYEHGVGYSLVENVDDVEAAEDLGWKRKIRDHLAEARDWVQGARLAEALGADARTWGRAMGSLMIDAGGGKCVERRGGAKRTEPIEYRLADSVDI